MKKIYQRMLLFGYSHEERILMVFSGLVGVGMMVGSMYAETLPSKMFTASFSLLSFFLMGVLAKASFKEKEKNKKKREKKQNVRRKIGWNKRGYRCNEIASERNFGCCNCGH